MTNNEPLLAIRRSLAPSEADAALPAQELYDWQEATNAISKKGLHRLLRKLCDGDGSPSGQTRISYKELRGLALRWELATAAWRGILDRNTPMTAAEIAELNAAYYSDPKLTVYEIAERRGLKPIEFFSGTGVLYRSREGRFVFAWGEEDQLWKCKFGDQIYGDQIYGDP